MIGKEDSRCSMDHIYFLINDQYISNSNTIANICNNYFINVGSSLASSIQSENYTLVYFHNNNKSINFIYLNLAKLKLNEQFLL